MSAEVLAALLSLCRAGAAALLLPLPLLGRLGLGLAGAALVAPALAGAASALVGAPVALPLLILRELLCGAALGLCAAVPIHGAVAAGELLCLGAPARRLLLWLALALYSALGGFLALGRALGLSYELVPLGVALPAGLGALLLLLPARLLLLGLLLGAHPAAALLLAQLLVALALRPAALAGGLGRSLFSPLRALFAAAALLLGAFGISAALRGRLGALPAELLDALRALAGR